MASSYLFGKVIGSEKGKEKATVLGPSTPVQDAILNSPDSSSRFTNRQNNEQDETEIDDLQTLIKKPISRVNQGNPENNSRSRSPFKLEMGDGTISAQDSPNRFHGSSADRMLLLQDERDGSDPGMSHQGGPGKSSVMMAVFNFTNSIIGAGIMGLPYAMNKAGLGMGVLLLLALTVIVDWSVILLVQNGKLSGTSTYQDMVHRTFGYKGYLLVTIFQFLFAYGGMAAYMVIVADNMPKVMDQLFGPTLLLGNRSFLLTILTVFVMYPLSCYRNITKLASTSMVSLVAVLMLVLVVAIEAPMYATTETKPTKMSFLHPEVFQAIGVIAFAFVCHHNSFIIFESLRRPTLNRFSAVTHWSTGISLAASLCMAIPVSTKLAIYCKSFFIIDQGVPIIWRRNKGEYPGKSTT